MGKLTHEHFQNLGDFLQALERNVNPNIGIDISDLSSRKLHRQGWTEYTWEESVEKISTGIPEIRDTMKKALKINANGCTKPKNHPRNYYYGQKPNVPAAIAGMPKSMRQNQRIKQPTKTVTIVYSMCTPWKTSGDSITKSSCAVLRMIAGLEKSGIRVKLVILPYAGQSRDGNMSICSITLKDWRQPLNAQKLSFCLGTSAMFRRFGFAWLETSPSTGDFGGYGSTLDSANIVNTFPKMRLDQKSTHYVDIDACVEQDYDPVKIAKAIGLTV